MTEAPEQPPSLLREWTRAILIAVVVWLFMRIFLVEAFRIPSGSMEPTLLQGDFLFANKAVFGAEIPFLHRRLPAAREPHDGDLVIFDSVEEPGRKLVKRLMGVPGDTVSMRNGEVIRNSRELDEPFAVHADPVLSETPAVRARMRAWQLPHLIEVAPETYDPDLHDWGPIVVPPDSLFVLGDNRDASYDGRYWGFVPRGNVRARPMFIYFSYDPASWRALPFLTAIRWRRIFSIPR